MTQWLNRKTSMKIRKKLKLLLSIKKAKETMPRIKGIVQILDAILTHIVK